MSKPILVANWKNNPNSPQAVDTLLKGLSRRSALYKKIAFYIAPPLTFALKVGEKASKLSKLAVQDMSTVGEGVHTGEVDKNILKGIGARLAILGHSERRALGETDADVAQKVSTALSAGITPLVCIGEEVRDEDGEHLKYLREQMFNRLSGVKVGDASKLVIAYEPVWAVGKNAKGAVTAENLAETVIYIRKILSDMFDRKSADKIVILYGGSVDGGNAGELYANTGIRGFLVGRASLKADDLSEITEAIL